MQTTKFLFVIGLVATLAAFALTSGARDTEEQRQARVVLRQKMAELDAADAAATRSATGDARPPTAAPRTAASVTAAAPAPAVAPAVSTRSLVFAPVPEPVADAKATQLRDALRQAMTTLENSPGDGRFAAVPEATPDANAAQLRDALRRTMANLTKYPPSRFPTASAALVMEAPLSPLSGSKSARLSVLLERYTADQITPREYHTQRAAIVAEP